LHDPARHYSFSFRAGHLAISLDAPIAWPEMGTEPFSISEMNGGLLATRADVEIAAPEKNAGQRRKRKRKR
jgi:hypothetical protein